MTTENPFFKATSEHRLWSHPFLARCRAGELDATEVRSLAGQMYKFSREFNRYLAAILARCDDEEGRVVIAENLWEELGEGDLDRTHPALFRKFTRALGIDDQRLEAIPAEPETRALVDFYLTLPERCGWLPAIGAICYASEHIVASLYTQLLGGIKGAAMLSRNDLEFFHMHVGADVEHARVLSDLIEPRATTPEAQKPIVDAVIQAMDARCRFFDAIERRILIGRHVKFRPSQPPEVRVA